MRARYETLWRDQLAAGQKKGLIRSDIDVRYLTLSLLNLLNWTIFWYEPTGRMSPTELAEVFFAVYVEGVQDRGSASTNHGQAADRRSGATPASGAACV